MATYPLICKPSFSYDDHLMYNQYVADLNKGLMRATSEIVKGQALSTIAVAESINRNADFLAETITGGVAVLDGDIRHLTDTVEYGLDNVADAVRDNADIVSQNIQELKNVNAYGFNKLVNAISSNAAKISQNIQAIRGEMVYGLDRVSKGINGLRADFDIAMGKVISQFEIQRTEIRIGFERMISILENRRKVEAREHFSDALEFFHDGCRFADKPQWFFDALKHFSASVEQYERNPLAHLYIGHIYHYQPQIKNFDKALHHYRLCYTYGEADEKDYPLAAQGYFYAGWLCAAAFDDLEEAINLTKQSLQFDAKLGEAYYHLAKYHAIREEAELAVSCLEKVVTDFDRGYCLKASADPDFDKVRKTVNSLFQRLKGEAQRRFEKILALVDRSFDPKDAKWRSVLEIEWQRIDYIRKKNAYFVYLDAVPLAKHLLELFRQASSFHEKYEKKYKELLRGIEQWDIFLQSHICLYSDVEKRTLTALKEAKALIQQMKDYTECDRAISIFPPIPYGNDVYWVNRNEYDQDEYQEIEKHQRIEAEKLLKRREGNRLNK